MQTFSLPPPPPRSETSSPSSCSTNSCCSPWQQENLRQTAEPPVGGDAELAKEMNALSVEERERIYEELHCVAKEHEETPGFVDKCLKEFEICLSNVKTKKKKNLNKAFFLRPQLETDQKFKLKFLRADLYDAGKAVTRMIKHFDLKCNLFGEEKLAKTISMEDLTETDLKVFRLGYVVELPEKDQIRRPVICADSTKLDFEQMDVESILRCYWYMVQASVETEIAQKKGVCCLCYSPGGAFSMSDVLRGQITAIAGRGAHLISCMPIRYSSFHFCYDDPRMQFLVHALRLVSEKNERLRLRAHLGTELENEYKLMTFGIKGDSLLRRAAMGDTTIHHQYVERRQAMDQRRQEAELELESETQVTAFPRVNDILIGRGHAYRDYPGNTAWTVLINQHLDDYLQCQHNIEKTKLTVQVVKQIKKEANARFLQRTNDGWKIMDDGWASEKAAVAFRNRTKALAAASDTPTTSKSRGNNNKEKSLFRRTEDATALFQKDAKRARHDPHIMGNGRTPDHGTALMVS